MEPPAPQNKGGDGGGGGGAWGGGGGGGGGRGRDYESSPQPNSLYGGTPTGAAASWAMQNPQAAVQGFQAGVQLMQNPIAQQAMGWGAGAAASHQGGGGSGFQSYSQSYSSSKQLEPVSTNQVSFQVEQGGRGGAAPSGGASAREADLLRREAEVARREEELRRMQREGNFEKKRNWPICCPFFYHNIKEECRPELAAIVRWGYISYLIFLVCLLWQWICVTALLIVYKGGAVSAWFLSSLYLVVGGPGAFYFWYKRMYFIGKDNKGWVMLFVWYAVHFGFCCYCAVAPPVNENKFVDGGSVTGWLSAINAFKAKTAIGIMYIAGACAWSTECVFVAFVYIMFYRKFRNVPAAPKAPRGQQQQQA